MQAPSRVASQRDWRAVTGQELRDLWVGGGRGLLLSFVFSIVLSLITYLAATNRALNFLEQREAVNLALQVGIGVGSLLALLTGADGISGERERATLETSLVTPVSRRQLVGGKLLAALSLWVAAFVITIPYVCYLGRGVAITGEALAAGVIVGTLLAVFFASLGMLISIFSASNRLSLSLSFFLLLALFAPTQIPAGALKGLAGEISLRVNPLASGLRYVGDLLVDGHSWSEDLSWLISPIVAAVVFAAAALAAARFIRLRGSVSK
jgi:ABC-2 type transport system permease protein